MMNVEGDFRYVSPREFREFGNFFKANKSLKNTNVPYGFRERKEAFKPGGIIAKKLADTRYSVVQVGSWIFVHGAITSYIAERYSLDEINKCVRRWLHGEECDIVNNGINDIYHNDDDSQSPFWSASKAIIRLSAVMAPTAAENWPQFSALRAMRSNRPTC